MSDTPTPPDVGSLWEHESGERRRVRLAIFDDDLGECVAGVTTHNATFITTLTDWHAWAENARRIA